MVDHEVDFIWILMSFLVHLFYIFRKVLTNLLADHSKARSPAADNGFLLYKGDSLDGKGMTTPTTTTVIMTTKIEAVEVKKAKKRPSRIVIPEILAGTAAGFGEKDVAVGEEELEVEGSGYCLFSRKGKRHVMEDGYGVMTDINGDPKQAFFGVFDGHGGRAAVDYVSQKLGENIIRSLAELGGGEDNIENAIKLGYMTTDKEFLSKGVSSGACAATALLKDGVLHVANAGDCRAVMSKKGAAVALTTDHRPSREDERNRIESLGGYVHCCRNQVWRVQGSLAVSRSFGDSNLKKWIISEPETNKLRLTSECHSLIIASDGLWEKVTDQEAVDVVSRNENLMKSCKELVDMSCRRGTRDDVSVMVVDLLRFVQFCE